MNITQESCIYIHGMQPMNITHLLHALHKKRYRKNVADSTVDAEITNNADSTDATDRLG